MVYDFPATKKLHKIKTQDINYTAMIEFEGQESQEPRNSNNVSDHLDFRAGHQSDPGHTPAKLLVRQLQAEQPEVHVLHGHQPVIRSEHRREFLKDHCYFRGALASLSETS